MLSKLRNLKERFVGIHSAEFLPRTVPSQRIYSVCEAHGIDPNDWSVREFTRLSTLYASDSFLARIKTKKGSPHLIYVLTSSLQISSGLTKYDHSLLTYLQKKVAFKSRKERVFHNKHLRRTRAIWKNEFIHLLKKHGLSDAEIITIGKTGPLSQAAVNKGGIWLFTEATDTRRKEDIVKLSQQQGLHKYGAVGYFQLLPSAEFVADLLRM